MEMIVLKLITYNPAILQGLDCFKQFKTRFVEIIIQIAFLQKSFRFNDVVKKAS